MSETESYAEKELPEGTSLRRRFSNFIGENTAITEVGQWLAILTQMASLIIVLLFRDLPTWILIPVVLMMAVPHILTAGINFLVGMMMAKGKLAVDIKIRVFTRGTNELEASLDIVDLVTGIDHIEPESIEVVDEDMLKDIVQAHGEAVTKFNKSDYALWRMKIMHGFAFRSSMHKSFLLVTHNKYTSVDSLLYQSKNEMYMVVNNIGMSMKTFSGSVRSYRTYEPTGELICTPMDTRQPVEDMRHATVQDEKVLDTSYALKLVIQLKSLQEKYDNLKVRYFLLLARKIIDFARRRRLDKLTEPDRKGVGGIIYSYWWFWFIVLPFVLIIVVAMFARRTILF